MGEYAKYQGEEIKIGTCEDLYYLRADQAFKVEGIDNSLDPRDPKIAKECREKNILLRGKLAKRETVKLAIKMCRLGFPLPNGRTDAGKLGEDDSE